MSDDDELRIAQLGIFLNILSGQEDDDDHNLQEDEQNIEVINCRRTDEEIYRDSFTNRTINQLGQHLVCLTSCGYGGACVSRLSFGDIFDFR